MALRERIRYLRREHEELLHLADRIEKMLESVSKNHFGGHLKSLSELRSLEHGLAGIVEHCHAENRIVESTYREHLQRDETARIDAEHEQIIRAVMNFREELKFATADRTMAMILPGMDVVNRLWAHIAYERELLGRIAELEDAPKRAARRKKLTKGAQGKKKKQVVKRRMRAKPAGFLPYTLEPHPEL
jgi:hypothetical protein